MLVPVSAPVLVPVPVPVPVLSGFDELGVIGSALGLVTLGSFVRDPLRFISLRFMFLDRLSRACASALSRMLVLLVLMSSLI